jgi:hypothetical protein
MAEQKGTASKAAIERFQEANKKAMDRLGARAVRTFERLMHL